MSTGLPESNATLQRVRDLLNEGRPDQALNVLNRTKDHSHWAENARGVCLMRLGYPDRAVWVYRSFLLVNGTAIWEDAPTVFVVNFATAMLLSGNMQGAVITLDELHQPDDPGVNRLRGAIDRWRQSQGVLRRIWYAIVGMPDKPIDLDFPPGEA